MSQTTRDIKTASSIIQLGLFVESIISVLNVCILYNKQETIVQFRRILEEFPKTLNEEEMREFQKQLDTAITQKTDNLVKELNSSYTPDEVKKIISQILQTYKKMYFPSQA